MTIVLLGAMFPDAVLALSNTRMELAHAPRDPELLQAPLEQRLRLLSWVGRHGHRFLVERQRRSAFSLPRAQRVDRLVADDIDQPRHRARHRGIEPARAVPHIHESLLQHLFRALPAVQYTERDPQQTPAGRAVHLLERRAIPQRDARQQNSKVFVGEHGGAIERASVDRRCGHYKPASPRFSRASPRARGGVNAERSRFAEPSNSCFHPRRNSPVQGTGFG